MNSTDINEQKSETKVPTTVINPKFGNSIGVYKRSLRPSKSLKPLSFAPKKIKSVSRIQKISLPQEKSSESI